MSSFTTERATRQDKNCFVGLVAGRLENYFGPFSIKN